MKFKERKRKEKKNNQGKEMNGKGIFLSQYKSQNQLERAINWSIASEE